jgi:hypothetical protein
LIDAGVVADERAAGGRRFVVRNPAAFHTFIAREFPEAPAFPNAPSRIADVAQWRDTKATPSDLPEIVLARAWPPDLLWHQGRPAAAAAATARYGVFSFRLHPPQDYALRGPCALVENPAVFQHLERLRLPVRLALYGHGRLSHRLLDWLADQTAPEFRLLHLPDYDPVGLNEHERLGARLGARVALHLPPDLELRFERFANRQLLDRPNNRRLLATLRHTARADIRQVLALIDRHNAGLEQEALLL